MKELECHSPNKRMCCMMVNKDWQSEFLVTRRRSSHLSSWAAIYGPTKLPPKLPSNFTSKA